MTKERILEILEGAKDKTGSVPMSLVRKAFENIPQCEQHWIPFTPETMPEDNVDVLVCDMEEEIYLSHMTKHKKFFDIYGDEIKGLVAWQPLPSPYREEDDE